VDCLKNSSGHGLPQIAKPGNPFLRVLWAVFLVVALVGGICLIYQAAEQYSQYSVITTTKINRQSQLTLPAITLCSMLGLPQDMILYCNGLTFQQPLCKWHNLTILIDGHQVNCVQMNHGTNKTDLDKAEGEGSNNGYSMMLYTPPHYPFLHLFAMTDNAARVVLSDVREKVIPGQDTQIALSKTVQTALGPPYSPCNMTQDYRQVTCADDCSYKTMTEICGCYDLVECDCRQEAFSNSSAVKSKCNKECPDECNLVSFPFNRIDVELDVGLDQDTFNYYKSIMSVKFDLSEQSDEDIKKRLTRLWFYFSRLETTEITQSPSMTPTNLFGNVGGLLGKIKPFI